MAEIQMGREQLQIEIEDSIKEFNKRRKADSKIPTLPKDFGAAIMCCLTGEEDGYSDEVWENSKKLWYDRNLPKATVPIGNYYIKIQDAFLELLKTLIKKGIVALLLPNAAESLTSKELVEFVDKLLASIDSLNPYDMCLAYKVVANPATIYSPFDKSDIIKWFPGIDGCSKKCNMTQADMHCSCGFFNFEDEICTIAEKGIIDALKSLEKKGIADPTNHDTSYKFKW